MTAHSALSCDQARLALSARLDGEPLGVPADRLGRHVDTCPACADWLARAEQVTRVVRLQPARVPDLTGAILAAVTADHSKPASARPRRSRLAVPGRQALTRVLQAAVAAVAAMQLLATVPFILGISVDEHASHEAGAFAAAVAVAFLLAAFQPRLARAYTPIAVVLAVCLTSTSWMGMAEHQVTVLREVGGYVGTIVQAALIFALGRLYPSASPAAPSDRASAGPAGLPV
jgi:predicted anti-sigma-YlaC factor YlaD